MNQPRWSDLVKVNLFWLAINFRNQAVFTYFTAYLVVDFIPPDYRNTALGFLNAAGLTIALVAQPLAGFLSDRNLSQFGRRRPFIFWGVILEVIGLTCLTLINGYTGLLILILFLQLAANISHGPYQGLIPDLIPEEKRAAASSIKAIFELLPTLIVGLTIARLLEAELFDFAVVITGTVLMVLMILTVWLVKERPLQVQPDLPVLATIVRISGMLGGLAIGGAAGLVIGALIGGLVGLLAIPLNNGQFSVNIMIGLGGVTAMLAAIVFGVWGGTRLTLGPGITPRSPYAWWIINRFMFLTAITSIPRFAPYLLMATFGLDRQAAIGQTGDLIIVVGIVILVTAILSPWFNKFIESIRLLQISGFSAAFGTLIFLLTILNPNPYYIFLAGGFIGMAGGIFFTTSWALGTTLVPPEQAGRYLGVSNLAGAGAGIVGMGIAGYLADYFNNLQPGMGYFIIYMTYGLMFLFSIASLRGLNPPGKAPRMVD